MHRWCWGSDVLHTDLSLAGKRQQARSANQVHDDKAVLLRQTQVVYQPVEIDLFLWQEDIWPCHTLSLYSLLWRSGWLEKTCINKHENSFPAVRGTVRYLQRGRFWILIRLVFSFYWTRMAWQMTLVPFKCKQSCFSNHVCVCVHAAKTFNSCSFSSRWPIEIRMNCVWTALCSVTQISAAQPNWRCESRRVQRSSQSDKAVSLFVFIMLTKVQLECEPVQTTVEKVLMVFFKDLWLD